MKRILLILTVAIGLVTLNFNTAKAQSLYVEINGEALYCSDGSDCNGGPDNRWRNSARASSFGWNQWNVSVDELSGAGWFGYTAPGWFASGGVPVTDNVQVAIDGSFESDGAICGGDDGVCSGSQTVYDADIATTQAGCNTSGSLERFRGCADGITWGVRFNWRYYVESASGGSVLNSLSGTSQTICSGSAAGAFQNSVSATMAGTFGIVSYQWEQSVGCTGTWTAISGANSATYNPGTPSQTTCYRRRARYISNFSCNTFDVYSNTLTITVDQFTASAAGTDQTVCATSATLAANTPTTGGGTWTVINGSGTFSNANSPTATVSGLSVGLNTFRWTLLNGVCNDSQDDVNITRDVVTTAAAGLDQTLCNSTSTTLAGNTPTSGTGTWTVVNGCVGCTFSPNASTPGATLNNIPAGSSTVRWTLTNGVCSDSQDDVIITRDVFTAADAGANQTLCGATSTNLSANTPVTGVGTWSISSGCAGCTFSNVNSPTTAVNNLPIGTSVLEWSLPNGSCNDSQDQITIVNDAFTTADAGTDQTICDNTSAVLAGNTPTSGSGAWSIVSGCVGCTFSNAADPGATLSNIPAGTSTVRWTLDNASCTNSQDDVNITRDITTAANAGPQQNLCEATSTTLAGNTPVTGVGTWTIVNGCVGCSFSNANSPTATVSNLPIGTSTLRWTLPNGTCGDSQSDVVIVNDAFTTADAGNNQTFCENTSVNISGNTPTSGTGLWTIVNGCVGCTFGNASSASTTLSNIPYGVNTIAWNLTNGNCTDDADQVVITRFQTDDPSFSYASSTYCENAGTNPVPTVTGLGGGTFSANSGNLVIDANTGEIDLVASTPGGPYEVTYQTNGNCPSSATFQVTITPADNSSFSFAQASYCQNATNPVPNVVSPGGTFSADPGLSINSSTGEIDLAGSTVGGPYTVTYTTPGPCPTSSTFQVSIIIADDASFTYASSSYCTNGVNPLPNITGLTGGTFTASPGLFVNTNTGELSLSASTPGIAYLVTYTTNGACPSSAFFQIDIVLEDDASFAYGSSSYCKNAGSDPSPVVTGLGGGTFSATPAGLVFNTSTGEIDLVASNAGVYTITYTTSGVCPNTETQQVTIINADNSAFSYADNTVCINGNNPVPTITGLNGGTFTVSDNSITINPATGEIDLSQSAVNVPFDVTYTTNGPCPTSTTVNMILLPAPVVSIVGLDADYCINEPTANLVGSPTGGTFAGLGIVGNTFSPTLTVAGTHTITYTYTDGNNCTAVASQQVVIYGLPFVSLSGLASSYCTSDNNAYPLTVSPVGGTLSGNGLSGSDFIPSTAGTGSVTITYSFTDANSCTNTASQTTTVNTLPVVGIAGLNAAYCIDAPAATLTGIPAGGTFSGTGISGNTFSPATAGVGTYTITYSYSDGNGCSNSTTQQVTVNDLPTVAIVGLGTDYCENAAAVNLIGNPPGGTFSGNGVSGNQLFPSIAGAGQTLITYSYTDGNSCSNSTSQLVTINAVPVVSFSGLATDYCVSASSVQLTGSPANGTFSGNGISGDTFDPAVAGVGIHTITYSYTDGNNCTATATQTVQVYALPIVAISNLAAEYCIDAAGVQLVGIPAGGTFSGVGVSGSVFTPSVAGAGNHNITYSYTDGNGCGNSVTQTVTVNPLPQPSISGLDPAYCADAAAVAITGTPAGGTFSGSGISGNSFNPALVGPGTYTITYTYTDGNTCTNSATQQVVVNALPVVNYSGLSQQYCISETTPQVLTGNPAGGTFSGPGVSGNSFTPSVAGIGVHTITYSYTDANGCSNSFSQQVTINNFPTVAITNLASQYCITAGVQTLSGLPAGGTFSGAGVTGNSFDPAAAGVGVYTITYSYTDQNGCGNTASQQVQVNAQPSLTIQGLAAAYCVNGSQVLFSGVPSGGTYSGNGVSGNTFNPSLAGVGTHTVTYSYTDGNGCSNTTSQQVVVNDLPVVSFTGLAASYCVSDNSSITLTGSPVGGTFSGNGISGNDFTPANAGNGTQTITYTYTDGNNCTNSSSQSVVVNTLPQVAITNLATQYCITAGVQAVGGIPAGGTFSGPGIVGNSFDPASAGVGVHTIIYTYSDGNNCSNTASQQVQVFAQPTVSISGLAAAYCDNGASVAITGAPVGGTFSGNGISGSTFFPNIAGVGTHTITYNYTDANGCSGSANQQVVVNAAPVVSFSGLAASYCVSNSTPVTLTGAPTGGTFSGNGVSGNTFTPSVAGNGTQTITYTYTDGNSCTGTSTQSVVVNTLPTVAINNLATAYCVTAGLQAIAGTPAGGTFSGNGVVGNGFNPQLAGVGVHTVTYTYSDGNNCSNTATQQVQVYAQPTVTLSGLASTYCSNATPVTFTGAPAGGSFSGPGVSGSTFFPNIAGAGTHTVSYQYQDANGCSNTATQQVVVNAAPQPAISGLAAAYCASVTSVTLNGTPANGQWNGPGITGNVFNPSAVTAGSQTITYTVTDGNNCTGVATQLVTVYALPNVGLAGLASTYCTTSPDATLTGFPQGGSFSGTGVTQPDQFSPALAPGVSTVTYTYTDGNNCTNSYTQFVTVNQAPNVSFTGLASSYCEGDAPVFLTGTPSGGTFIGNGISGNQFNPVFAGIGSHTITYSYVAGNGCSGSSTQNVFINAAPIVNVVGLAPEYCVNAPTVNLTGIPSGGVFSGSAGVSNSQFNPANAVLGQNIVNYLYTDGNGCVGFTDVITVVVPLEDASFYYSQQSWCQTSPANPAPTITGVTSGTFSASPAGLTINPVTGEINLGASSVGSYTVTHITGGQCPGTYTFPIVITNGANAGFNYASASYCNNSANPSPNITGDFGGQFTASPAGLSINSITGEINLGASVVGCYTVTYAVGGACPGSQTFNVCVNAADVASFTYPLYSYCQSAVNAPVATITGTTGGTFSSDINLVFNNNQTGEINLLSSQQGLHTITYTTSGVCAGSYSVDVFISNGPVADITTNGPTTFCFGGSVLLDAGSGYAQYTWSNPANVTTQVVSVSTSGVYSVVVTDSSGCSSTDAVSVLVYQAPIAAFTYNTFSLQASFNNLSSQGQTYTWDFGDGSALSNDPNPVHTYAEDSCYDVTLIVENLCSADTITIPVCVQKVGIDENVVGAFNLYPNPSDGNFMVTFEVASKEDVAINVMDVTGRLVIGETLQGYVGKFTKQYNFNTLDSGVYFYSVRTAKGVITKRIVISK